MKDKSLLIREKIKNYFRAFYFVICLIVAGTFVTTVNATDKSSKPGKFMFKHPVLNHKISKRDIKKLKRTVADIMKLSEEELVNMVPKQTPLIKNACPCCRKNKPYDKKWDYCYAKMFDYTWNYKKTNQIQCKKCKTVFPNKNYPMKNSEVFYTISGKPIKIKYYWDAKKCAYGFPGQTKNKKKGRKYYLDGVIDYAKWQWIFPRLEALAKLYYLTKEEKYARKAVLILNQYSSNFDNYLLTGGMGQEYRTTLKRRWPYGWEETRWGRRMPDETMSELLGVVDLVYESKSMDQLSEKYRCDIRKKIWRVFESGFKRQLFIGYRVFFGQRAGAAKFLPLGKVFGEIDIIHLVLQSYYDIPRYTFASDGSFWEGTGYAQLQNLTTAKIRAMDGYSDPVQYKGKNRVDKVYPFSGRENFYRKTYDFLNDIRYPNGYRIVVQDAAPIAVIWPTEKPRKSSINIMKPGWKHLIMGDGDADDQIQVHLGFGENSANHSRQDALGIQMYAFAHPLINVFPYHKSRLRKFSEMTVTHNSVVVDYKNQNKMYSDGDPLFYVSDLPGFCAFSADAYRVYRGIVSKYKRTLVLNTVDIKKPYLIDIFQVAGGKVHDYMLQSSTQFAESAKTSLKMTPMKGLRPLLPPGKKWKEPRVQRASVGSGYGLFFDVKKAAAKPYCSIDFICDNPWNVTQIPHKGRLDPHAAVWVPYHFDPRSWADKGTVGTRHHIVGNKKQQVFITKIPALKRFGFFGEKSKPSEKWQRMPQFIIRQKAGKKQEESLFVVIHEPFYKSPKIKKVKRINTGDPNVLALEINFKDRKDIFIYSLNGKAVKTKCRNIYFSGIMGLTATNNAGKNDAYLVGGKTLKTKSGKINLKNKAAKYTGTVISSSRKWDKEQKANSFTVETDHNLPEGNILKGKWIILKHHGTWMPSTHHAIKRIDPKAKINSYGIDSKRLWEKFYKDVDAQKKHPKAEKLMKGGGDCFEIARIEKKKRKTVIHLKDDHGLIIGNGKTQEYFYPCRTFKGKTTFVIYNSIGTQATPIVTPAGANFVDSIDVDCKVASSQKLMFAITAPQGKPAENDWKEYSKTLKITNSVDLHVKCSASDTIKKPKVFTYKFTNASKPLDIPGKTTSGLIRQMFTGRYALKNNSRPDDVKITGNIDAEQLVEIIGTRNTGKLIFSGFIRINHPGVYTFYYLADRDGTLKIAGKHLLSPRPALVASPVPRIAKVALRKGLYPIHFELYCKRGFRNWDPALKLEWSGPGILREKIPSQNLFHAPEDAIKIKAMIRKSPRRRNARRRVNKRRRLALHRGTITAVERDKKVLTIRLRGKKQSINFSWTDKTNIQLIVNLLNLKELPATGLDAQLDALLPEQLESAEKQNVINGVKRITIFAESNNRPQKIIRKYKRICGKIVPDKNDSTKIFIIVNDQKIKLNLNPRCRISKIFKGNSTYFQKGVYIQAKTAGNSKKDLSLIAGLLNIKSYKKDIRVRKK